MDQLAVSLEELGRGKGVDPERDVLIEGLRRENAKQLEELRRQQAALREQLEAGSTTPQAPAQRALVTARLLGIRGVPYLIAPDGRLQQGVPADLEAWLEGNE
jgi:hypothetical protein